MLVSYKLITKNEGPEMALHKAATSQDRHDSAIAQKKVKLGWCVDKFTTHYVFKCNNIFYKECIKKSHSYTSQVTATHHGLQFIPLLGKLYYLTLRLLQRRRLRHR